VVFENFVESSRECPSRRDKIFNMHVTNAEVHALIKP
jgi:hypothetical protein